MKDEQKRGAGAFVHPSSFIPHPFIALLLFALLTCPAAFGSLSPSALTGRVLTGGKPAAGVSVTATSPALLHPRVTSTGPRGAYWIGSLPPGTYELTFAKTGLQTLTRRAIVELARVARADARLEPSVDDETVMSTLKAVDVTQSLVVSTHFSDGEMDRLPLPRLAGALAAIAPGDPRIVLVDDLRFQGSRLLAEDILEEVTVWRAAIPIPHDSFAGGVINVRTRRALDEFSGSIRDTISNEAWNTLRRSNRDDEGLQHSLEANFGGPIANGLRFFAAAWGGHSADRGLRGLRGSDLQMTALAGSSHALVGRYLDTQADSQEAIPGASILQLRYHGVPGERTTLDAFIGNTSHGVVVHSGAPGLPPSISSDGEDSLLLRLSHFTTAPGGDHVMTAGVSARNEWGEERNGTLVREIRTIFAGDRISIARWVFDAGLQFQSISSRPDIVSADDASSLLSRAAVSFDVTGNGRHALMVSHGRFDDDYGAGITSVGTLGYAIAFGSSGLARLDLVDRRDDDVAVRQMQAEGRYRLFDRFDFGATWTWSSPPPESPLRRHVANLWAGADLPVGEHRLGVILLERYASEGPDTTRALATDLGLRFGSRFRRVRLTSALDVTGLLRTGTNSFTDSRSIRIWFRAGI